MTITQVTEELPDPDICHTSPVGEIKIFATCHVKSPFKCRHAMGFGDGYFCTHPNWDNFVQP